jgi:hypothetical protein
MRLGISTNPLHEESDMPLPIGGELAVDVQGDHGGLAIAPYVEYYRWSEQSRSYLGAHALWTTDVTNGGLYGGLGLGVARWNYFNYETAYYSPTVDLLLGGRNRFSSTVGIFAEGKLMVHRKLFPEYIDPQGEVLLSAGISVTL